MFLLSKQRADTSSRVPVEIPDDLDSESSSSDPSGAVEEEVERASVGVDAAEAVSGADDFAADISSADIGSVDTDAFLSASSGEKDAGAEVDTGDDEVSMDELEAAEASSDSTPATPASKAISVEEAVEKLATVGVVTEAERVVETTPVVVTSSGGIAQTEHVEVAASEDPVQAEVIPGSDVPVVEEELAQDPADDIDMADAHDSYDEVLAGAEDDVAGAQAADTGATAFVAAHGSPTQT
ncbi:hypothetical protein FCV25MIE_09507, partial [Fagus crenata]